MPRSTPTITDMPGGDADRPGPGHGVRPSEALADALEREHREIDAGIERFLTSGQNGADQTASLLEAMNALRRHIYLEEEFLFPLLRDAGLFAPLFVMLREHGEIWDTMQGIETELRGRSAGGPSRETGRRLLAQLEQHNLKEEAVIYPQADDVLGADQDARLREFVATGQMPPGWVCERAAG